MTSEIVGIIGPGGEGGTFLDWTLHYLAGDYHMKYILVDRYSHRVLCIVYRPLVNNPITNQGNAHRHEKAHPTEPLIQECVDLYHTIKEPKFKLLTMYIVPSGESFDNGSSYSDVVNRIVDTTTGMKIIQFYHPDIMSDKLAQRIYKHIPEADTTLDDIKSRVMAACGQSNKIINSPDVYSLNIETMFYDLDNEIHKIFSWLDIPIKESKYADWLPIYKQWQQA